MPSGGFKIAWNINRLETHSFSSSHCLSSLPGVEVGAAEPLLGGFRKHFKRGLPVSGFGKPTVPGGLFPLSARPRCVGRKKQAVVFHLWILQVQALASTSLQFPRKGACRRTRSQLGRGWSLSPSCQPSKPLHNRIRCNNNLLSNYPCAKPCELPQVDKSKE